jgi:hypothetical protein
LSFFGGGYDGNQQSNVVDIFNSTSQTWSTSTLSQARYYLASSSIGEFVAFGGGWNGSTFSSVVDMLTVTSNTSFIMTLTQARYLLASTSSTNKLFFGGGISGGFSDRIDIFEFSTQPSSTTNPNSFQVSKSNRHGEWKYLFIILSVLYLFLTTATNLKCF